MGLMVYLGTKVHEQIREPDSLFTTALSHNHPVSAPSASSDAKLKHRKGWLVEQGRAVPWLPAPGKEQMQALLWES